MAFTPPTETHPPLLLVTDAGQQSVHIIDVMCQAHLGYVNGYGSVPYARGVAAHGSLLAVSSYSGVSAYNFVQLFRGSGISWEPYRVLGGSGWADEYEYMPLGLRFSADGTQLAVGCEQNFRFYIVGVEDGVLARAWSEGANDAEQVGKVWVSVSDDYKRNMVQYSTSSKKCRITDMVSPAFSLAFVPGLGLLVRHILDTACDLEVHSTRSIIDMERRTSMARLAWMGAVWKGCFQRDTLQRHVRRRCI